MKNKAEIDWFKGARKYVQAADLVCSAYWTVGNAESFNFTSRKMASHPVRWLCSDTVSKEDIVATFSTETDDSRQVRLVATQDTSREISKELPFEESVMFAQARVDGQQVVCPLLSEFTVWEHISSLNKYLLSTVFCQPSWWFVRLEGNANLRVCSGEITINYVEKRKILYRSEIFINDRPAGIVDFALR